MMIRKNNLMCGFALLLASCATSPGTTITEIIVDPAGTEMTIEGFGTCVAPCRVEIDRPRAVKIDRMGFHPERFEIRPGQKTATVKLRLVAPTVDVDKGALPDLK